ncbi:hypothetical protein RRG08_011536 [Elysia crispata]|uniref:Uncharacterized protein n=1 Tax=Elysia crispata TaxID=231223 RepID=A0AAE1E292_9GAST|nr:hypothetical protein RRG08_011536 [Elysia crispata]
MGHRPVSPFCLVVDCRGACYLSDADRTMSPLPVRGHTRISKQRPFAQISSRAFFLSYVRVSVGEELFFLSYVRVSVGEELFFLSYVRVSVGEELFFLSYVRVSVGEELFFLSYVRVSVGEELFFLSYVRVSVGEELFFSSYFRVSVGEELFFLSYSRICGGEELFFLSYVRVSVGEELFFLSYVRVSVGEELFFLSYVRVSVGEELFFLSYVRVSVVMRDRGTPQPSGIIEDCGYWWPRSIHYSLGCYFRSLRFQPAQSVHNEEPEIESTILSLPARRISRLFVAFECIETLESTVCLTRACQESEIVTSLNTL